jgi:hypothetical protein
MNNIVRNETRLKISRKIPEKIKHPTIIATNIIAPKKSPDKIIPPGTVVNLMSNVVKSPTDKSPNVIFSLWSVIIMAATSQIYATQLRKYNQRSLYYCLKN